MPQRAVRFGVRSPDGRRSSEWRVWWDTKTGDVYIAARLLGGELKASLHESGRCHVRAPVTRKWRGNGSPPDFLDTWYIDPKAPFAYPFGVIIPTSELRAGVWSKHRDRGTIWLTPDSAATEVGVFLTRFEPTPEQYEKSGWIGSIADDDLSDGRRLRVLVGKPEFPAEKRDELNNLRVNLSTKVTALENPRLVIVAGQGTSTRHFVEAAAK